MSKKSILIILDGWGEGDKTKSDAIYNANVPFMNSLYTNSDWKHSQLKTSGNDVGLPTGQMGNSEVGHLNIGGGRVVFQDLVRINNAVKDNSIAQNKKLTEAYTYAKENNKAVHLIGLIGDGGVHSLSSHLIKLCDVANDFGLNDVFVHAQMDGRDTDPRSGKGFMQTVVNQIGKTTAKVATISGRFYGMDRDKRWERIKTAYDMLTQAKGAFATDPLAAIQKSYDEGVTDEFIKPVVMVDENNQPIGQIKEGDVVICFNFRTDRLREISTVLSQQDMPEHGMKTIPSLHYVTMARYDESFKNVHILFDKVDVSNTIGEVIEKAGKKQIRIAETEKYAHVTFFFSGGREKEFENEKRILIPSPKVMTYDLQPEMNAYKVKDAILPELKKQETDFICLNFANADMVGHTGIYEAITAALEAVDSCVKEVVETAIENNYSIMIIADHGNADFAVNNDGSPNTAHSLNPVPCLIFDNDTKSIKDGRLADVAPTLLTMMKIGIPEEMTGEVLVS